MLRLLITICSGFWLLLPTISHANLLLLDDYVLPNNEWVYHAVNPYLPAGQQAKYFYGELAEQGAASYKCSTIPRAGTMNFECPTGIEILESYSSETSRVHQLKYEYDRASWPHYHDVKYDNIYSKLEKSCPINYPLEVDFDGGGVDVCVKQKSCPIGKDKVGNPISCSSGVKIQSESIYSGSGPDALHYSTHYSSPEYFSEIDSLSLGFTSYMGSNRSDNYGRKLELVYEQNGGKIYRVTYKNGFSHIFYGASSATTFKSNLDKSGDLDVTAGGFIQSTPSGADYYYNNQGQLTQKISEGGSELTYTYTASGQINTVANRFGKQLTFSYNSNGLLEKLTTPDGQDYLFVYDANANLVKIIYPDETPADQVDNAFIEFLFEDSRFPNHLTGKINEKGVRYASWSYDDKGRAITSEHGVNLEKVQLDYSVENQTRVTTFVSDSLSSDLIYHYENVKVNGATQKQLMQMEQLACTDCTVGSWHFVYDSEGNVLQETSPNGNITTYEYYSGLKTKQTNAKGTPQEQVTSTSWNFSKRRINNVIKGNLKTAYTYNNDGQVTYEVITDLTNGESRIVSRGYNNEKLLSWINGPRTDVNDITNFTYDTQGNLTTVSNALGHVTAFGNYDENGRVGTITNANGTVSSLTYTPRGWLKSSNTNGALTQYEYYADGMVSKITSPSGSTLSYEYDDGNRLVAIVDSLNNRIDYQRDLMGNVTNTAIKDSGGNIKRQHSAVFNALGQLAKTLGSNGQYDSVAYDADGNSVSSNNALNNATTSTFDALNRLEKMVDADNAETLYAYDDYNRIKTVTDATGRATNYTYNAFGNLTRLDSPDTGVSTFTYDKAGNIKTKTDARGVTVSFTYDALNRVLTQSYSDASENITYNYDSTANGNKGIGRLTSVTDQTGSTAYHYDAFGNVTKQTRIINGKTYVTEYHFDLNGQMTGVTYPSGRKLTYGFDSINRVTSVSSEYQQVNKTLASNITYMPFGPMNSMTYGNGKVLSQSYDLDYRLTGKSVTGVKDLSYSYDLTNNITAITNSLDTAKNEALTYDKLSRLLTADGGYGSIDYSYDKIGNRLSKTENGNSDTYNYSATSHRLNSVTGANAKAFTYDAMGNTLVKGDLTFTYNKQGRMATASKTGMNANYEYSFKGERSRKLVNGNETHYIYDLNGQLIAEANDSGSIIKEYIYVNGQRLATVDNGALYYVHTSHLDTPVALTDEAGVIQWQGYHTPFGKFVVEVNNVVQGARFPGQYYDDESGLHYNYFRDYAPEIGRYIQSDPIGLNGGINTYGYVGANPFVYTDFYGLSRLDILNIWNEIMNQYPNLTSTNGSECGCNENSSPGLGNDVEVNTIYIPSSKIGGFALTGDSIYINSNYLADNLTSTQVIELRQTMIHELLHAHINRQIGSGEYLYGELMGGENRHDWVYERTRQIDSWLRMGGVNKPNICDF